MFCTMAVHSHTAFDFHKTMYNNAFEEEKKRAPFYSYRFSVRSRLKDPRFKLATVLNDPLGEPPVQRKISVSK